MIESQNYLVFWLEVAAIFVLLYFLILLIDKIVVAGGGKTKLFWKRHICDDFPSHYSDICFTCSATSCVGCEFEKRGGV